MKRSPVIIDAKEFGRKLRDARIRCGKKQSDVAKYIGVVPNSISYYEKGRSLPSLDLAVQLSHCLNVSLDYLVGISFNENKHQSDKIIELYKRQVEEVNEEIIQEMRLDLDSLADDATHLYNVLRLKEHKQMLLNLIAKHEKD